MLAHTRARAVRQNEAGERVRCLGVQCRDRLTAGQSKGQLRGVEMGGKHLGHRRSDRNHITRSRQLPPVVNGLLVQTSSEGCYGAAPACWWMSVLCNDYGNRIAYSEYVEAFSDTRLPLRSLARYGNPVLTAFGQELAATCERIMDASV